MKQKLSINNTKSIAILGAGSWGTSVAIHIATKGFIVNLWTHSADAALSMQQSRCNEKYLPGIKFPNTIHCTNELSKAILDVDFVMIAVPSHAFMEIFTQLPRLKNGLCWITKGIEPHTQKLFSEIIKEQYGDDYPTAIISGPSFAKEVANGLPTALTIASKFPKLQKSVQHLLHHHNLRTYLVKDIRGVEIAGTIKNVLAIACGISDGLGYGANARAALITRGLNEMRIIGHAMGAKAETFMGLAGVGDLVLTCTDTQSRNRRFGLALGQGQSIEDALNNIQQVVEGQHNATQVIKLAEKFKIEMPICLTVFNILTGQLAAKDALNNLMMRPAKDEF